MTEDLRICDVCGVPEEANHELLVLHQDRVAAHSLVADGVYRVRDLLTTENSIFALLPKLGIETFVHDGDVCVEGALFLDITEDYAELRKRYMTATAPLDTQEFAVATTVMRRRRDLLLTRYFEFARKVIQRTKYRAFGLVLCDTVFERESNILTDIWNSTEGVGGDRQVALDVANAIFQAVLVEYARGEKYCRVISEALRREAPMYSMASQSFQASLSRARMDVGSVMATATLRFDILGNAERSRYSNVRFS